ncbi:MAG TPA: GDSL-type esterase/lipase family protein, partial [Armatimonadota bacterium]
MSTITRDAVLKPALTTDSPWHMVRQAEFDYGNESLVMTGVRPDVLFIGDSITHLWDLQAYFGGTGKRLVNRGIGGDTTTLLRERFPADALQLRPRRIVMKIGINDLLGGVAPETVLENIVAIANDTAAAGIPLAHCSVLPIWGPSWSTESDNATRINRGVREVNAGIRDIAKRHGVLYVDYYTALVAP